MSNLIFLVMISFILLTTSPMLAYSNENTVNNILYHTQPSEKEMSGNNSNLNEDITFSEDAVKLTGTNMDLRIDPVPFDIADDNNVNLSFTPKTTELKGSDITPNKIDHLDYKITVLKDGKKVWTQQFHDHDGKLQLKITSSGSGEVTGGDETQDQSSTGPYTVNGGVFDDTGSYTIKSEVVGIEFNPLPKPLPDNFTLKVTPEFGTIAMLALVIGIISIVAVTAKTKHNIIPRI